MTEASIRALKDIRNLDMLEWYVIPLFAIVLYIYTSEMKKAKAGGNWNVIFSGLTVFGMDFINETWNGWVLHFTERSAFWTAPGDTALRTMVGWNIEIMFMFAISGIIYYNTISEDKTQKIIGIPNQWFWAMVYSIFCVFVECFLNKGGHLIWEYSFWNRSFAGVWLIFLFGYFHFYVAALLVINMKTIKSKVLTVSIIYTIAILANIFGLGIMKWQY